MPFLVPKKRFRFSGNPDRAFTVCGGNQFDMNPLSRIPGLFILWSAALFFSCDDDKVDPIAENKLVAMAGTDRVTKLNQPIELDASASRDGNNKPFSIAWSVKLKPQGSAAKIEQPNAINTTFTPDAVGIYVIRLTLTQGTFNATDELTVTATASEPGGPQTIVIQNDINQNRTLTDIFDDPAAIDYLVTNDIDVRAELVVMPGVTIAFAEDKGMQIMSGFIHAKGTAEKKITFRGTDDAPASWKGLVIHTNSSSNEFDHVTITQGGSSAFSESGTRASLAISGTTISGGAVKITNTEFAKSGAYGFYLQGMASLNTFASNRFVNNKYDLYVGAHQLHNVDPGTITSSKPSLEIETGGPVSPDQLVSWKPILNGSYIVRSDIFIASGVTVEPGASFKMKPGTAIHVTDYGYLQAVGSEASKIVFTSTTPDVYWKGIYVNTYSENNKFRYCEIANAGSDKIADAEHPGNIVLGHAGIIVIENSVIKNGLGYGVVAKTTSQLNANMTTVNTFIALQKGMIFPEIPDPTPLPALAGVWLDEWSFKKDFDNIQDNFYNPDTQSWFSGAADPWATGKGIGLRFDNTLGFTWLIAEHSPMTGCESWSAEYITGTASIASDEIIFHQNFWRSKFVNSCDPSQNVDMEVTPSDIPLTFKIEKMYDVLSGEEYWQLKFTNPDGSTFSFFRTTTGPEEI